MQTIFQVGQRLSFSTDSSLYRDIYEAEIVAVHPDRLDLRLFLYRGYFLLLPVGTKVYWMVPGSQRFDLTSVVLTRDIPKQVWSVTIPKGNNVSHTRVLAVGSGKGGVGKTTFSINLSLALSQCRQRVILLDADIGMANVEVLLGMSSSMNLAHVINGDCTLTDILAEGPEGIRIIPGSSGISSLTQLDNVQFNRIVSGFAVLENQFDIMILDTGAGLSDLVLRFLEAADEIILVTTPEPHALMDAYALTKALAQRNPTIVPNIIINRCETEWEAKQSSETLIKAANQFLRINPVSLGWLPNDKLISRSLKEQKPLFLTHPHIEFSRSLLRIAEKLSGLEAKSTPAMGLQGFWQRLKRTIS